MIRKYRKKTVVIEAIQWLIENIQDVEKFFGGQATMETWWLSGPEPVVVIKTLEGEMRANVGDWIIKGVKGEFYPCKPDIFVATYEPVEEAS